MVPGRELDEEIYRRLFERRILQLGEPLEHWNSNRLCAGLLLLAAEDPDTDIRLLINSPGGSVPGMLAIRDCMRSVPNDVITVDIGMAYSAGQFLLSSGTPGKRYILPHAKVLLHQGSSGIGGTAQDIAIQAEDLRRTVTRCSRSSPRTPGRMSRRSSATRAATAGSARRRPSPTVSSTTSSTRPK